MKKIHFIILMIALNIAISNFGCMHKKRSYYVGNSLIEKVTIEEYVKMYLKAKCEGDTATLLLMIPPPVFEEVIDPEEENCGWQRIWLSKDPLACRLEIEDSGDLGTSHLPNTHYVASLRDTENPEIVCICEFRVFDGRLFIVGQLIQSISCNGGFL